MPNPDREKRIFEQALEFASPEERGAFVQDACAGDEALGRRVLALLRACDAPDAFLPAQPGHLPVGNGVLEPGVPGTVIGRYKLLEWIGEGGFGVVYMAEQVEPVRRRVALKLIKPGMDSRQVIGRFETERQALALMAHPNIAQVLDAGATAAGRPYFVMELVRGMPITQFCDEQQLGLEARLKLFIDVCSAVQHAHQKGVIHRDLKPSNILVTLHGEQPVPKVIDFGIAKATEQPLTDKTVFTLFQQFLGTPAYMSPEQVALSGLDVDTRSDVYSLGVLLYELLTGGPPFDSKELLGAGLDEMRRLIREQEPERPSTRLTKTRQRNAAPSARPAPGQRPAPIPHELDLIALKAIEKDRDRRYSTANGLATDLRRFLNHEPVTAVAPTLRYQLAKFHRRNRKLVATTMAFTALLVAATGISAALAIRARRAEAVAAQQAATAVSISEFFWKEILKQLTPWEHTNRAVSLHDAFERAGAKIDTRLAGQPLAEAAVRYSYGKAHLGLSELGAAETNLLRALELRRRHAPRPDEQTAEVLYSLATVRDFQNRKAEAEKLFEESAAMRAQVLGADHRDTHTAAGKALQIRAGRLPYAEAEPLLRRSVENLRRFVGPDSAITTGTMNFLGFLWLEHGRFDQAHELFDETRQIAAREDGAASSGVLWSLELMAVARARQGRFAEADGIFLDLIATRERVNGERHIFTLISRLTRVREVLAAQGRFAEAVSALLRLAASLPADQPDRLESVRQSLRATLQAWEPKGGGEEFEALQRQAALWLAPATPRELSPRPATSDR